MLALEQLPGGGAGGIQLAQRNRLFVRRDLKHAVGRGVDDPLAGPPMLGAELVEHRGAGSRPGCPIRPRPVRRGELRDHFRRESQRDRSGTACWSTSPQSSQWPVMLSLPALSGSRGPVRGPGLADRPERHGAGRSSPARAPPG